MVVVEHESWYEHGFRTPRLRSTSRFGATHTLLIFTFSPLAAWHILYVYVDVGSRRDLFQKGAALAAGVAWGTAAKDATAYTVPDLPYPFEALEPYIDTPTMKIHHDKHHGRPTEKKRIIIISCIREF